jgi:DNA-binding GntR family transcriptional regulator
LVYPEILEGYKKGNQMNFDTASINEKIYQLLRERIIFGEYAPGSRIEIKNLSQELNVSPQPVKEAIFRLTGEGFITIVPRRGTYVRQATLRDLIDMVEARILYETGAIDLAAGQIKEKDLKRLEDLCTDLLQTENKTYREIQKKNMAFHCAVVSLSKNRWLDETHELLMGHYACLHYRYVVKQKDYSDAQQIYKDHRMVVDALGQKDAEEAKKVVRLHMQRVKDKIEKVLFSDSSGTNKMGKEYAAESIKAAN